MHLEADLPSNDTPARTAPREEGVTIVIPAYKEERGIGPVLESLGPILDELEGRMPVEVIVVDDGSPDKTAEAAQPWLSDRIRLGEGSGRPTAPGEPSGLPRREAYAALGGQLRASLGGGA
jgi:hypothetical protein